MTGPVPPTLKAGPLACTALTNVVPAGRVSVSETACASDGPALVSESV